MILSWILVSRHEHKLSFLLDRPPYYRLLQIGITFRVLPAKASCNRNISWFSVCNLCSLCDVCTKFIHSTHGGRLCSSIGLYAYFVSQTTSRQSLDFVGLWYGGSIQNVIMWIWFWSTLIQHNPYVNRIWCEMYNICQNHSLHETFVNDINQKSV
jgi:hypothetical protein